MSIEVMGGGGGIFPTNLHKANQMSVHGDSTYVTSTAFSVINAAFENIQYIDTIQIAGSNYTTWHFQCAFGLYGTYNIKDLSMTLYGCNFEGGTYQKATATFHYNTSNKIMTISNIILGDSTSVRILSKTSEDLYTFAIIGHTRYTQ